MRLINGRDKNIGKVLPLGGTLLFRRGGVINVPIQIDNRIVQDVVSNAREVLARHLRGAVLIFPDIIKIYNALRTGLESP
jgi:hypothetical protein